MIPSRFLLPLAFSALSLGLAGCASQNLDDYANDKPVLELAQYFNGPVTAHGMFQERNGHVLKRFTVAIEGHWQGDQGTLDEHFSYADGSRQRRVWHLTRLADGRYSGRADDVVGEALGESRGNTFHWRYTLALPVDGKVYEVQMDDWMYLIDGQVLLNRTRMSKFGWPLGEVTLSFDKP